MKRFLTTKVPAAIKPNTLFEAEIVSGAPSNLNKRLVRIYQPTKTAMQSGIAETKYWKLQFDSQPRWENELMGWSSTGDPMHSLNMKFKTSNDAVLFCQRQGFEFKVEEPKMDKFEVKSYSKNFKYTDKKLKYIHTKYLFLIVYIHAMLFSI